MKRLPRRTLCIAFAVFSLHVVNAGAGPITPAEIDTLVARTMKSFDVPGVAVAIVHDDTVVYA